MAANVVVSSPSEFARAVAGYRLSDVILDAEAITSARASITEPGSSSSESSTASTRRRACSTRLHRYSGPGPSRSSGHSRRWMSRCRASCAPEEFDFDRLWSLPGSAEFFCGNGRFAAPGTSGFCSGSVAKVASTRYRLRPARSRAGRPSIGGCAIGRWPQRLLAEWDERLPLLVLTGAFHAQLEPAECDTMAAHLARARPGLQAAMLSYTSGQCWWRGEVRDVSPTVPESSITIRLPTATPAVVPGWSV